MANGKEEIAILIMRDTGKAILGRRVAGGWEKIKDLPEEDVTQTELARMELHRRRNEKWEAIKKEREECFLAAKKSGALTRALELVS
jgi:hypothetical protein